MVEQQQSAQIFEEPQAPNKTKAKQQRAALAILPSTLSKKLTEKQRAELARKQKIRIPDAPKSLMTDGVVSYLQQAAKCQPSNTFAETLGNLLKEPKVYLMRALVNTVPHETILDLVGKTIDI